MTRCWTDLTLTERSLSPSAPPHRYRPPNLNETELEPNKCQQMSTKGNKCPQMVANVNRRSALQVLHNYEAKRKREHLELQLQLFIFQKPIDTILYWFLETAIIIFKKIIKRTIGINSNSTDSPFLRSILITRQVAIRKLRFWSMGGNSTGRSF